MKESQFLQSYVRRGREEGMRMGRRENILVLVRAHFGEVPEDIRLAVEGTDDLDTLRRWLIAVVTATTLDELRAAIRAAP